MMVALSVIVGVVLIVVIARSTIIRSANTCGSKMQVN